MKKNKLSYERAIQLFRYDKQSGNLYWKKVTSPRVKVGNKVGNIYGRNTKYLQTSVDGTKFLVHRIIWLMVYKSMPKFTIDHIDGNGLNNRIKNLRDVPYHINSKNLPIRKDNSSGVIGISKHSNGKFWVVQYINKYHGIYKDFNDAVEVRNKINKKYKFHPNHGRRK